MKFKTEVEKEERGQKENISVESLEHILCTNKENEEETKIAYGHPKTRFIFLFFFLQNSKC